jgi:hypothetical protein
MIGARTGGDVADMKTPGSIAPTLPARLWAVGCLAGAAILLLRPRRAAGWAAGPDRRPPTWLVRVLGIRELLQGTMIAVRPTRRVLLAGCLVDVLHAASMAVAAILAPPFRRPALASGLLAAASATIGTATIGTPTNCWSAP